VAEGEEPEGDEEGKEQDGEVSCLTQSLIYFFSVQLIY